MALRTPEVLLRSTEIKLSAFYPFALNESPQPRNARKIAGKPSECIKQLNVMTSLQPVVVFLRCTCRNIMTQVTVLCEQTVDTFWHLFRLIELSGMLQHQEAQRVAAYQTT